jgi:hypothetical protein
LSVLATGWAEVADSGIRAGFSRNFRPAVFIHVRAAADTLPRRCRGTTQMVRDRPPNREKETLALVWVKCLFCIRTRNESLGAWQFEGCCQETPFSRWQAASLRARRGCRGTIELGLFPHGRRRARSDAPCRRFPILNALWPVCDPVL